MNLVAVTDMDSELAEFEKQLAAFSGEPAASSTPESSTKESQSDAAPAVAETPAAPTTSTKLPTVHPSRLAQVSGSAPMVLSALAMRRPAGGVSAAPRLIPPASLRAATSHSSASVGYASAQPRTGVTVSAPVSTISARATLSSAPVLTAPPTSAPRAPIQAPAPRPALPGASPAPSAAQSSSSSAADSTTSTPAFVPGPPGAAAPSSASVAAPTPGQQPHLRAVAGEVWVDPTLDEWPENDYRIIVTNLGNDANDTLLAAAFKHYPSMAKVRVVRDKRTHASRGYGFVSFLAPLEMARALREMQGKLCGVRPMNLKRCDTTKRDYKAGVYGDDVDADASALARRAAAAAAAAGGQAAPSGQRRPHPGGGSGGGGGKRRKPADLASLYR